MVKQFTIVLANAGKMLIWEETLKKFCGLKREKNELIPYFSH